jgi:hypothetical protein
MEESEKTTVIDLTENPKNAALYFDYVLPLHPIFCCNILHECIPVPKEDILSIFPKLMQDDLIKYFEYWWIYLNLRISKDGENDTEENDVPNRVDCVSNLFKYMSDNKFDDINLLLPQELDIPDCGCGKCYDCSKIMLSQLSIVDTSKTEWEHIIKFREDKYSVNKLRRLKLFFHDNYSGKEKNFIQDDLLQRLDDYKTVVKDWGFETITSSITLINTSLTSVGSSLVLALTGQPLEVAASTGICVGIGNMALHIAKEKYNLMKLGRDHPLAYIIEAKKKLEK